MLDRRSDDWSAQGTSVGLDQVDPVAVEHARAVLREHPDPRAVARSALGTPDLLRALGVLTPEQTLTSGGVLLFAPGGVEQIAYTFRRTMAGELSANEHLTAPLMTALRRALELVDTRQDRTPVDLRNGVQDQVADIPASVVREAIVNAVMHRDHRRPDRIVIEHSPGRLKVTSPGALVSGVTVDTVLTTASRVRNAHLAGVIRSLGLAETAGTGIDRMYARMLGAGHPEPRYETDPSQVSVTLLGGAPDAALVRFVTALPGGRASDADAMLILHALLDRPKTTARAMAPHLQRSTQETQRVLAAIADDPDGFLEPTRESRTWAYPEYRLRPSAVADLGTAVARGRQPTDDSQRRVLDLLRESGEVTPGMVRVLLGVQPATVSRLLSGMVSRGLVVRTSPKARGPGP
jgi:ATP-dependent DNA helicase RecG